MPRQAPLHPPTARGWTHILENGKQLAISDELAASLVFMGVIQYSPEDGPNARVYRPRFDWETCEGWTLDRIKTQILGIEVEA